MQEITTLSLGRETVLIVDDEPSIIMLISETLNRQGYKTITASSGEDALEKFKSHADTIDLLVSDVIMRGMNGLELVEFVKIIKEDIKVIFISGYSEKIDPLKNDYPLLSKPVSPSKVATKVREVLDGAKISQDQLN